VATNEAPTILIVDDDRSVQRLLADALAEQGFSVAVERDGEWAVDTFNKRPVDAVVLDLLLPAINGYEVARIIRSSPRGRTTPIVMISGVYKSPIHRREAVEKHGAFAFLEKPIRLSALFEALRSALGDRYPKAPAPSPLAAASTSHMPEHLADPLAQEEAGFVERHTQESQSPGALGIRGDFRQRPFPEVLAEIFHWKGTGALLLRRDKVKKIVYFRDGQPLSIKSNLLSECLGGVMVSERIISEAECEESIRRMKATRRRQGAILIEMGSISPHNLVYALNLQLRMKLFEVFSWEQGDYRFDPRIAPPAETVNLEMSTAALIYEGVRRHFEAGRLRRVLGDADALRVHRSNNPDYPIFDAGLGEEEQQLLRSIDGSRTVADLRALELLSPLDTDRLIYAMRAAGLIELKGGSEPMGPAAVAQPTRPSAPAAAGSSAEPKRADQPSAPTQGGLIPEVGSAVEEPTEPNRLDRASANPAESRVPDQPPGPIASSGGLAAQPASAFAQPAQPSSTGPATASSAESKRLDQSPGMIQPRGGSADEPRSPVAEPTQPSSPGSAESNRPDRPPVSPGGSQAIGDSSAPHVELQGRAGEIGLAEAKFQLGEELLRERRYQAAHQLFQEAVQINGQAAQFYAYLGWSKFQMQPEDPASAAAALDALQKAISLNPTVDKSYLFSGYIYKALGRIDQAETQFEKAIECNPDCTEALQELKSLTERGG
jgi:CheY-like chemotaxis protein